MQALLLLVSAAFAGKSTIRGDAPTHATAHAVERVYRCKSAAWQLVRPEPDGSTWSVELCGQAQYVTVHRSRNTWSFESDGGLRTQARTELGCKELTFALVDDPEQRRVQGCGVDVTYTSGGPTGWVQAPLAASEGPQGYSEVPGSIALRDEPMLGDPDAPFTVLEYTDFGCPHCAEADPAFRALATDPKIQVRTRLFPLDGACNAGLPERDGTRCAAAIAATCAQRQGKYWDYAAILYQDPVDLGEERLSAAAVQTGLDPAAFAACRADSAVRTSVTATAASGQALQLVGVPTFFVRGLQGSQWVTVCGTLDDVGALIHAAEGGAVLPMVAANRCP